MDFDLLSSSPEFSNVMNNPLSLAVKLEERLNPGEGVVEHSAGSSGAIEVNDRSDKAFRTIPDKDNAVLNTGRTVPEADLPLPVSPSSSPLSDSLFEEDPAKPSEKGTDKLISEKTVPTTIGPDLFQVSRNATSGGPAQIQAPKQSSPKPKFESRHTRVQSGSPIPLKLLSKMGQQSSERLKQEHENPPSKISPRHQRPEVVAQRETLKPKLDNLLNKATESSLLTWADEVITEAKKQSANRTPHVPGGFEEEDMSDTDSFRSMQSTPQEDVKETSLMFSSYSDIAHAFSSLSNQVQTLENRLIRHERECASDMAALTHRAGANWSQSSRHGLSKPIGNKSGTALASDSSTIPTAPVLQARQKESVSDTVSSLVSAALREHGSLPPRVATARARALMINLHKCSDSHKYTTLPGQLDQMICVLQEGTLSNALARLS
jgi:hypothetical protein